MPTSNKYANLYSSDSEDEPVFEEIVSNSTINSINTYYVVPLNKILDSTPTKLVNKQRKMRRRTQIVTIKRSQSDTTASSRFLSTDLHSASQAIIRANNNKIAL